MGELQSRTTITPDPTPVTTHLQVEQTNLNYKKKWEEAEAKCRMLENKFHQLETGTIKQLQEKIAQLQRDYNQMKVCLNNNSMFVHTKMSPLDNHRSCC